MVTRDEVAREAGTSTAVVSYVMNNGPRNVSEATRQRVLAAVERLGYRPNAAARSLRASTGTAIGLIVPDITNPYCGELALAIENSAMARNHMLLLGNTMYDDARRARHLQTFLDYQVRGIVFIGSTYADAEHLTQTVRVLEGRQTPLVFLDQSGASSGLGGMSIIVDNEGGAHAATQHLLEHGHDSVALFSGLPGLSAVRERTDGWARALRERGVDPAAQQVVTSGFDRYAALEAARRMFEQGAAPRAIFAQSDEQAIGILFAANQMGLRIPEDVALVSFDGIKESAAVSPALTTVQQPIAEAGAMAVEALLSCASPEASGSVGLLPTELVVRASCGCR